MVCNTIFVYKKVYALFLNQKFTVDDFHGIFAKF